MSVRVAAWSADELSVSSCSADSKAAAVKYELDDPNSRQALAAGQLITRVLDGGTPLPKTEQEKKTDAAEGNLMPSCTRFTPKEKAEAEEDAKALVQGFQDMEAKGVIRQHDGT